MTRWMEHFLVLPFRWFSTHIQTWYKGRQRCKVCGCRDKFDFKVRDDVWVKIIPEKYQNRVVCLACFDDFAQKKEVDYSTYIDTLYFAGDKATFKFSVCSRREN